MTYEKLFWKIEYGEKYSILGKKSEKIVYFCWKLALKLFQNRGNLCNKQSGL